jgi:hypothetical protein
MDLFWYSFNLLLFFLGFPNLLPTSKLERLYVRLTIFITFQCSSDLNNSSNVLITSYCWGNHSIQTKTIIYFVHKSSTFGRKILALLYEVSVGVAQLGIIGPTLKTVLSYDWRLNQELWPKSLGSSPCGLFHRMLDFLTTWCLGCEMWAS